MLEILLIIPIFYFVIILIFILTLIKISTTKNYKISRKEFDYKYNPMTETEKTFIKTLKPFTDKNNLIILSQVPLQAIFKTYTKSNFNKIKAKSIDFAIVENNYNYKGFIELDDYTHNRQDRIKRDIFVNKLFSINNLILKRIKVKKEYNLLDIDNYIKEITNQNTATKNNFLK